MLHYTNKYWNCTGCLNFMQGPKGNKSFVTMVVAWQISWLDIFIKGSNLSDFFIYCPTWCWVSRNSQLAVAYSFTLQTKDKALLKLKTVLLLTSPFFDAGASECPVGIVMDGCHFPNILGLSCAFQAFSSLVKVSGHGLDSMILKVFSNVILWILSWHCWHLGCCSSGLLAFLPLAQSPRISALPTVNSRQGRGGTEHSFGLRTKQSWLWEGKGATQQC